MLRCHCSGSGFALRRAAGDDAEEEDNDEPSATDCARRLSAATAVLSEPFHGGAEARFGSVLRLRIGGNAAAIATTI
jgi:hypothetical protein